MYTRFKIQRSLAAATLCLYCMLLLHRANTPIVTPAYDRVSQVAACLLKQMCVETPAQR